MAELYVKMLGSPSVQVDGQSVAFPYRKADALVYSLISRKNAARGQPAGLPWAGVAALLVPAPDAGDQAGAAVYDYAVESRLRQRYPTLMLDFYRDCLYADRCISGDGCFVGLLSDGTVTEYRGGCETPTDASFRRTPLGALLSRFVKTQQAG